VGFRADELEQFESYRRSLLQLVPSDHEAGPRQPFDWYCDVIVDDLELAGEYPGTVLVISFHRSARPECRYAWHTFLWALSPDAPPELLQLADNWTSFLEYLGGMVPVLPRLPCEAEPYPLGATEAKAAAVVR
jgi:hypothetical protein